MMLQKFHRMWARGVLSWMVFILLAGSLSVPAQSMPARPSDSKKMVSLNYKDAPLDLVLDDYSEWTGRTLIKSPSIPKVTITLRSFTRLTQEEALIAVESALSMNNVTLVPMGEKFYKVVTTANARQEAMPLSAAEPGEIFPETDKLITRMIRLQHIPPTEAQPLLQSILHGYGKMQVLEQINSMMVTDTSSNLERIQQILEFIDQPIKLNVEHRIYTIKHAKASEIASKLNEIIQTAQEQQAQPAKSVPTRAVPAGVIRARQASKTTAADVSRALAEKGIVQGKVKIISDERTNIMIIISDPVNFEFFSDIVKILDVPTDPEIAVKVVALEYADAEEISGTLNEFIGAASAESEAVTGTGDATEATGQGQSLRDYAIKRAQARTREPAATAKAKIGQLSPDTKILADKRTNSLLLMGPPADIEALMDVIQSLDVMLSQVIIEAVILEVSLSEGLAYGVDWLQRSMTVVNENKVGPRGGISVTEPVVSFGGGWTRNDRGINSFKDGGDIQRDNTSLMGGALTYYLTMFDLNIDAIVRLAASSSDARVLATPVVLTTDNTEAKIVAGEERPIVTSTTTDSGTAAQTSHYEYKNIGLELVVTPHINPKGFVVMEISQTADNLLDPVQIDGNEVPVISKRELTAEIAVNNGSTIILGGLVSTRNSRGRTKIPILGDIPLLGALFRSDTKTDTRVELIILITPYVLMTPEDALEETARIHSSLKASKTPWPKDWSKSLLSTPEPKDREAVLQAEKNEIDLWERINKRTEEIRGRDEFETRRDKPVDRIQVIPVPLVEDVTPEEEEPPALVLSPPQVSEPVEGLIVYDLPGVVEEEIIIEDADDSSADEAEPEGVLYIEEDEAMLLPEEEIPREIPAVE